jgi:MFS family permease
MLGGSALAAGSIMVVPFAPNIGVLIVALCLYGVSAAFLGTAPAAAVGDAAGGRSGTAVAIFSMSSDAGAIVGPLVAGFLSDRVSYPVAFAVGAALLLVGTAASARMPRGPVAAGPSRAGGADEPVRVD